MAGRHTKLDDLTAKRIVDAAIAGVSRRAAAEAAHIDQSTLFRWLAMGRDGESPYREFRERLLAAEAKAERVMVDVLFSEAKTGKWQPALAWLERRHPVDWAKREGPHPEAQASPESQDEADETVLESLLAATRSRKAG